MIFLARGLKQHHRVPQTPTNKERLQWFRAVSDPVIGNGYFVGGQAPWLAYAKNETLDGRYPARED